jgi:hypothetical protein
MVQTYGSGDSGSGDVVERPDQAALPDRRGDLLEGGGRRGGSWQACLLPRGGHGAPDLREILRGLVVHYTHHEGERKMFVCKNQNYLKNKAEIKNHKKIKTKGRRLRKKDLGKIKWDAASVPHDKCREDYAATHVTRQKDRGIELRGKILKILRGKKKKGVENSQAVTRQ